MDKNSPMSLAEWLEERRRNAESIASMKRGVERDGWLEDADYFRRAAEAARRVMRLDEGAR